MTVSVNISGLAPGTYLDSVNVASVSANNSPVYEKVRLTVTAAPKFLDVTPDTLTFTAQEGASNPPNQNFGVIESGAGVISYTLDESTPWFSLNKGGGNTPDVVTVMVDITGLAPDTYYGNVTVSSGQAANSPITEVIKLVVTAVPKVLQASPNSLGFDVVDGGAPFSPATVHVSDSFNVGLAYTVGDGVSWANVSPTSGTTPDSFRVIADTAAVDALAPGFYQDTILITSAQATNSPVRVFVTLEVLETPNNPPVINSISDFEMNEGEFSSIQVFASDIDGDPLFLFNGPLPSFVGFSDLGNGTGEYTFAPNFSDAGVYPITLHASDSKDTASESFTLTVLDKEPGTEGDTV
ncbi:MAG: BACON domain-containing protein, partial [Candidatus Zixiibacteriota bacterium]